MEGGARACSESSNVSAGLRRWRYVWLYDIVCTAASYFTRHSCFLESRMTALDCDRANYLLHVFGSLVNVALASAATSLVMLESGCALLQHHETKQVTGLHVPTRYCSAAIFGIPTRFHRLR